MELKHTPGPYSIVSHSWAVTSIFAGDKRVCVLDIEDEATEETQDTLEEQQAANAALLGAAPDLLAALIGLDEAFCSLSDDMTRDERNEARLKLIAARAAIAKATGAT